MLTIIIPAALTFIISLIVMIVQDKLHRQPFDWAVIFISLFLAVLAAIPACAVVGLLSIIPSASVEVDRTTYSLVEQSAEGSTYYVVSKQQDEDVDYSFDYIDEDSHSHSKSVDGGRVVIHDGVKSATVTFITKSVPDIWKLWVFRENKILYQIDIPSMSNVRYE